MGSIDMNQEAAYVTIVVGSLIYLFALCSNLLLLAVIAAHAHLHQPMYILLFSLSFNDIVGATAMIPPVLANILSETRQGTFLQCLIQALALHWYAGLAYLILSAMAFDRYIAICHPLRYHAIMTNSTVLHTLVWCCITNVLLVGSVFGLTLRFPVCSTAVPNFYCDNMSILRITCAKDTSLNNIYGLFITGFYHGLGVTSIVFSYTCILIACFRSTESDARAKALSTCATHFLVFIIYECSAAVIVLVYRIPQSPPNLKKFMAMSFVVFPSCLNPIIYGAKTKEIKQSIQQ
ncbi:olfactory receptor 7G2-like, partial [Engraulis encrasicolus]|uniref:olfactory receptor 7G2-like n=1 Tax=Engraulis encrasicolus TaxID=184585 RepID=UPI002FD2391C